MRLLINVKPIVSVSEKLTEILKHTWLRYLAAHLPKGMCVGL